MTGLIVILCLILIIMVVGIVIFLYIRNRAREFSRELFGTEDIKKAAKELQVEYSSTPKSVSAMTSLLLPKISEDFPDFNYNEMKVRATNVLTSFLAAITAGSVGLLKDGNAELKQKLTDYIGSFTEKNLREHFDSVQLHRTEISQYRKSEGRCIITFQTSLECFRYTTDLSDGSIKSGSTEYKYQTRYNVDLIYIQDRSKIKSEFDHALGVNCPNCGAPLSSLGAKTCAYCGTPIVTFEFYAWTFNNIEEVSIE